MSFQRLVLPGCTLLIVLTFVSMTRADPDLWGHVRFGQDMLASGTIHVPDTYSFTADKPWTNHEWLAEVIMALAYRAAGASGLVLLKLTIIAISLVCVWRIAAGDGAGARPAAILSVLALAGILPRAQQVRPQLFSVLCFSLLVLLLRHAEKRPALLWLAPALLAFWANTHGGWLVGCGTLGLWCAARTWTLVADGPGYGRAVATIWSACAASFAATLVNPYGIGLWRFLGETVGLSRRFIPEWGPVTGAFTTLGVWSIFALLVVVALKRPGRVARLHAIVIPIFWGVAAFKVSRLDAFFALSTIAFLSPDLIRVFQRRPAADASAPSRSVPLVIGAVAIAMVAVAVPRLKAHLTCIDIHESATFPEAGAIELVRSRQLGGRMVTFFDWGQYAIWHKPDGLRISMDGRRETVYSDRTVDQHLDMYLGMAHGLAYLDSLHADYVWLPRESPLSNTLMTSPLWTTAYRGGRSIIYARSGLVPAGTALVEGGAVQSRCFPGP